MKYTKDEPIVLKYTIPVVVGLFSGVTVGVLGWPVWAAPILTAVALVPWMLNLRRPR